MSANQKKGISLKMHKTLGKPWHEQSTLVFKSKDEKVVIGRCEDDTFIELDDETIELATEWKFQLDPSLVADEEEVVSDEDKQRREVASSDEREEKEPEKEKQEQRKEVVSENVNNITNVNAQAKEIDMTEMRTTIINEIDDVFSLLLKTKTDLDNTTKELSNLSSEHEQLKEKYAKLDKTIKQFQDIMGKF